jgi:hypothetical protein
MGIKTADGKQNFKLASILIYHGLIKFSQRYIADIIGVTCSLRIPHEKWSKGWRACQRVREHRMQIQLNCMLCIYSVFLCSDHKHEILVRRLELGGKLSK